MNNSRDKPGRGSRERKKSTKARDSEEQQWQAWPGVYGGAWIPEDSSPTKPVVPADEEPKQDAGASVATVKGEKPVQSNSCGQKARGRRALTTAQREVRVADRAVLNEYMAELVKVRKVLQKVRMENALLEAYQADGWCSASREKVKPVAEIARARAKIQQYKAELKKSIQTMDESGGDQPIDHAHYDSDGELGEEHIFCSKCGEYESCDDNDIILCDGNCRRAYHQKCVMPPIDLDAIAEDEPWLCPACDAKDDATEFINDEFGTEYTLETPWRELFIEPQRGGVAGAHAGGGASLTCCLARTSLQTTRTTWTLMWQARGHQTATIVMGAAAVSQSAMGGALTATLVVWMTSVTGARERSRTGRTSSGAFRRRLRPAWRADRRKGSRRRRPPSWSAFLQSGGGRLWTTRRSTRSALLFLRKENGKKQRRKERIVCWWADIQFMTDLVSSDRRDASVVGLA